VEAASAVPASDPKPTSSEIERAVAAKMPAFLRVASFSVDAMENVGTKVDPQWRARFRVTFKLASPTFFSDGSDGVATFLRPAKTTGESINGFGKSVSILYAGAWRTTAEFEGQPLNGLGLPISDFGTNPIIRGSPAEAAYSENRRKMFENTSLTFVGKWRTKNGIYQFRSDGSYEWDYDAVNHSSGSWSVAGEQFYLNGKPWQIVRIDQGSFVIHSDISNSNLDGTRLE